MRADGLEQCEPVLRKVSEQSAFVGDALVVGVSELKSIIGAQCMSRELRDERLTFFMTAS